LNKEGRPLRVEVGEEGGEEAENEEQEERTWGGGGVKQRWEADRREEDVGK